MHMNILLVADIYGNQNSLEKTAGRLRSCNVTVDILSPYSRQIGENMPEQEVYRVFLEHCGHEKYTSLVAEYLSRREADAVVAFSAGASAAWLAAAQCSSRNISHLICFYPTRIRKYKNSLPICPATVIFPSAEKMFDVKKMAHCFNGREKIKSVVTPYMHGFLNPLSEGYSAAAEKLFCGILSAPGQLACQEKFIKRIRAAITVAPMA